MGVGAAYCSVMLASLMIGPHLALAIEIRLKRLWRRQRRDPELVAGPGRHRLWDLFTEALTCR
jgi:hypothetical protein